MLYPVQWTGVIHYRQGCPVKNRDVPVKARGQQPTTHKNEGANTRVTGALQGSLEDNTTSGTDKANERVEQLRRELRQTELDMSLAKATATTNVLSNSNNPVASDEGARPTVGPTLIIEIQVEGQPTQAVIDTGSPVSLISIDVCYRHYCQVLGEK